MTIMSLPLSLPDKKYVTLQAKHRLSSQDINELKTQFGFEVVGPGLEGYPFYLCFWPNAAASDRDLSECDLIVRAYQPTAEDKILATLRLRVDGHAPSHPRIYFKGADHDTEPESDTTDTDSSSDSSRGTSDVVHKPSSKLPLRTSGIRSPRQSILLDDDGDEDRKDSSDDKPPATGEAIVRAYRDEISLAIQRTRGKSMRFIFDNIIPDPDDPTKFNLSPRSPAERIVLHKEVFLLQAPDNFLSPPPSLSHATTALTSDLLRSFGSNTITSLPRLVPTNPYASRTKRQAQMVSRPTLTDDDHEAYRKMHMIDYMVREPPKAETLPDPPLRGPPYVIEIMTHRSWPSSIEEIRDSLIKRDLVPADPTKTFVDGPGLITEVAEASKVWAIASFDAIFEILEHNEEADLLHS